MPKRGAARLSRKSSFASAKRLIVETVLLALLALVPVAFYRGTTELFEFPKTELLVTGTLVIVAVALAGQLASLPRMELAHWVQTSPARIGVSVRREPLGAGILLFLASAIASTAISIRPDMSIFGPAQYYSAGLRVALATSIVYFASRSLASNPRWLERLARAAVTAMTIATVYALLQFARLDPLVWNPSATFGGRARWPGTLAHANHLGTYVAMTLPLALWLARRSISRRGRGVYAAAVLVALAALVATLSRGAWVGFAVGGIVFIALAWRAGRLHAARGGSERERATRRRGPGDIIGAALLVVVPVSALLLTPLRPALLTRFHQLTNLNEPSANMRVLMWRAGIRMAMDHPLLGVGTDAYLAAFPRYRTPAFWRLEWNVSPAKAHNELIHIAATQGVLGLFAALVVVFLATRAVWRATSHPNPEASLGAAAAGGSLAAFGLSDLVSFTVVSTGCLAAALAGWAAGVTRDPGAMPRTRSEHLMARSRKPGALALGVSMATAATLWIPLVLLPWFADTAAAKGHWTELSSPLHVRALARASAIAPWDTRYASELGCSLLARAFAITGDSSVRWNALTRARSAFERAVHMGPQDGENRAFLGRVLASQAAIHPREVLLDSVRAEFSRAVALEPTNADVLELAAQGYLELGRTAEARASALRCAALFPDFALPMADIGAAALLEGRAADAADTLRLAMQRDWHGQGAAAAAAERNYAAALRELGRLKRMRNP